MALLPCSFLSMTPVRQSSFCHWLEPGRRRWITEIRTFTFLPWEGKIEKPRFNVVSEKRANNRGIGARSTGKIRRCPCAVRAFPGRSQQTWVKGLPRVGYCTGVIAGYTHMCRPCNHYYHQPGGVYRLSPYSKKLVITVLYFLELNYSSNSQRDTTCHELRTMSQMLGFSSELTFPN